MSITEAGSPAKRSSRIASTRWALLSAGNTLGSARVSSTRRKGRLISTIPAITSVAIGIGWRSTKRPREYQRCSLGGLCSRRGASAFTRGPSIASIAGSTVRLTSTEVRATKAPPTPIE